MIDLVNDSNASVDPSVRALAWALLVSELKSIDKSVSKEEMKSIWAERKKEYMATARRVKLVLHRQGKVIVEVHEHVQAEAQS